MLVSRSGWPRVLPDTIETPSVIVDEATLRDNIARGRDIAARHQCAMRPHVKTHKSISIARLQLLEGAIGVTTSKADETVVFIRAGISSVTCAYPVVDAAKIERVLTAARDCETDIRFIADSEETIDALEAVALRLGVRPGLFLKVDVGLGRVGVEPDSPRSALLAERIARSKGVWFQGLLSHAGHAYGASSRNAIVDIAKRERADLTATEVRLRRVGIEVPELSVGSTPTVMADPCMAELTEIRPGNYVFFDLTAVRLGICTIPDVALGVLSTVVSVGKRHAIIDAGSKVLSSDLGAHGLAQSRGYGRAFPFDRESGEGYVIERLSEEHGFVAVDGLKPGDRMLVLPNHSCAVSNLVGRYIRCDAEGLVWEEGINAQSAVR